MKKLMIITLGTGQGVESGLARSIVVNNPEGVIFVVTQESLRQKMPEKVEAAVKTVYHQEMPHVHAFPTVIYHEADVKEVYQATLEAIRLAQNTGYTVDEIYLDFTSGTKAMSVGAVLAALFVGCKTMVYVGGFQRDLQTGRVISGSEVVMTFTLQDIFDIFGNYSPQKVAPDAVFRHSPKEINL